MQKSRPRSRKTERRPPRPPEKRPGRPGGKRDQNRRARVEQLAGAALANFLRVGIANVTVDDIVGACGVAKGTFYRYFDNKAHLVETIIAPVAALVRAAFQRCAETLATAREPLELVPGYLELARTLGALVSDYPDEMLLYLQESRAPATDDCRPIRELTDEIRTSAVDLTRVPLELGLLRTSGPIVSAFTVVGAAETLLYAHLRGDDVGGVDTVTAALVDIVLHGILRRPPAQ